MSQGISSSEVRWANIGNVSAFDYGGLIEIEPTTERGIYVDVLDREGFAEFKNAGRLGVKMFGLTSFGVDALRTFKSKADKLHNRYNKYFHYILTQNTVLFDHTTRAMSDGSFSFNTVSEMER